MYEQYPIELLDHYEQLPDELIISGGNLVLQSLQELRVILKEPSVEEFFNYIKFLNQYLLGKPLVDQLNDLYNDVFNHPEIFQTRFPQVDNKDIRRLQELTYWLLQTILSNIYNDRRIINPLSTKGNCYRIIRYNVDSITLGKFLPYE